MDERSAADGRRALPTFTLVAHRFKRVSDFESPCALSEKEMRPQSLGASVGVRLDIAPASHQRQREAK